MTVEVHTARVSCRDPDRFDITRKSGSTEGKLFAPSWDILRPALNARRRAEKMRAEADACEAAHARRRPELAGLVRKNMLETAEQIERAAWERYVPLYTEEMRVSYVRYRPAWDRLLARTRVVLVCYCSDPQRCHRRLLAEILTKIGATDRGELPAPTGSGTPR